MQDVCTNLGEILVMDENPDVDNYKDVDIPYAAEQALSKPWKESDAPAAAAAAAPGPA